MIFSLPPTSQQRQLHRSGKIWAGPAGPDRTVGVGNSEFQDFLQAFFFVEKTRGRPWILLAILMYIFVGSVGRYWQKKHKLLAAAILRSSEKNSYYGAPESFLLFLVTLGNSGIFF